MKFRKRPVVIEAVQYEYTTASNVAKVQAFCPTAEWDGNANQFVIPTLEGDHRASVGDWIIKGVAGEFYPIRADIFEATYEAVEEVSA